MQQGRTFSDTQWTLKVLINSFDFPGCCCWKKEQCNPWRMDEPLTELEHFQTKPCVDGFPEFIISHKVQWRWMQIVCLFLQWQNPAQICRQLVLKFILQQFGNSYALIACKHARSELKPVRVYIHEEGLTSPDVYSNIALLLMLMLLPRGWLHLTVYITGLQ